MRIPRRLKEIISRHDGKLSIEQEKRGFALVRNNGDRMTVDLGQVVTLDQWDRLSAEVAEFAGGQA